MCGLLLLAEWWLRLRGPDEDILHILQHFLFLFKRTVS
jgi:hypothetical protein